jgi:hypothetical protein
MRFDRHLVSLAERFLSDRTFHLVVAPAVADLQFEQGSGRARLANHVAVLRAVVGGSTDDLARASSGMMLLTLIPACYYIFLMLLCFDVSSLAISTDFLVFATIILVLSFAPVMVCFWPERQRVPID